MPTRTAADRAGSGKSDGCQGCHAESDVDEPDGAEPEPSTRGVANDGSNCDGERDARSEPECGQASAEFEEIQQPSKGITGEECQQGKEHEGGGNPGEI